MTSNRVWIEVESPYKDMGKTVKGRTREEADRIGTERAQALTRMLHRLGILPQMKNIVWWDTSERRKGYCWTLDEAGSYVEANDHGHWYNLDWLGRPAE
jgi:hypothetical protein